MVGKFVEYFGHGLAALPLADRATIGNMSPEYGATCGFFPVDERDARLPAADRPRPRSGSRSSRPTARRTCSGTTPSDAADVLAGRRARPRRPSSRASPARAARRTACRSPRRRRRSSTRLGTFGVELRANGTLRQGGRGHVPGQRPDRREHGSHGAEPRAGADAPGRGREPAPHERDVGSTATDVRARARRGRHRGDHELHEHVEPAGDGRRRAAREEGGRARPAAQAVGEDEPRARLEGRDRVLRPRRPDAVPRAARLPHRRLRLHDLHRQLRPAAGGDLGGGRPRATSSSAPCSPATATSRRASTPR